MARDFARAFYAGRPWKECRGSFIASRIAIDGGKCYRCDKQGYIVDHVIELTPTNITDSNIALNHDNCAWLCLICHNKKYSLNTYIREDLMFNELGDVVKKI